MDIIEQYQKIYNLHPSYLPYGKGFFPVFWALWEETPAGATIHEITEKVDEGPVVLQKRVDILEEDTGGTLHSRVKAAEKELFVEHINNIKQGILPQTSPQSEKGTYHTKKEFFELKKNTDIQNMKVEELCKLVKAFTFDGFTGLELKLNKQKFHLKLERLKQD